MAFVIHLLFVTFAIAITVVETKCLIWGNMVSGLLSICTNTVNIKRHFSFGSIVVILPLNLSVNSNISELGEAPLALQWFPFDKPFSTSTAEIHTAKVREE